MAHVPNKLIELRQTRDWENGTRQIYFQANGVTSCTIELELSW
jgi:hypothetical protein